MGIITYSLKFLKPSGVHAYIDRIQVWVKKPADRNSLALLRTRCGHLFVTSEPARFDDNYRQRIEMKQPGTEALEWVATRTDALINRADLAIDYCCSSIQERDQLYDFLNMHLVRRWHAKNHSIVFYPGKKETRYDSPRKARSVLVAYKEPFSRVTGELNVTRIEWRATGARAVRRCGISTPQQLNGFDHRVFWNDRLLLMKIDKERAGRFLRNKARSSRSRTPETVKGKNLDKRRGHVLLNSVACIQELLDRYGGPKSFRIGRLLERISVTELLPAANTPCSIPAQMSHSYVPSTICKDRKS